MNSHNGDLLVAILGPVTVCYKRNVIHLYYIIMLYISEFLKITKGTFFWHYSGMRIDGIVFFWDLQYRSKVSYQSCLVSCETRLSSLKARKPKTYGIFINGSP